MNRDELLDLLRTHKAILARCFGVTELALYGSFARDQGTEASDIDILVGFDTPPRFRALLRSAFLSRRATGAAGGPGNQRRVAGGNTSLCRAGSNQCLTCKTDNVNGIANFE